MAFLSRPFAKDYEGRQEGMQQEGMIVCAWPRRIGPGHPRCIFMLEELRESRLPLVEANNSKQLRTSKHEYVQGTSKNPSLNSETIVFSCL